MPESPPGWGRPPAITLGRTGSTLVATDALWAYLGELSALDDELRQHARRLGALARAPWSAVAGRPCVLEIERARMLTERAASEVRRVAHAVEQTIENYAEAEQGAARDQERLARLLAVLPWPTLLPVVLSLAAGLAPSLLPAIAADALARALGADPEHPAAIGVARRLTDVGLVRAVELAVANGALSAAAAGGAGPVVAGLLGPAASSPGATARLALATGAAGGMLRETPVRIDRTEVATGGAPPQGAEERLERVPEGDQVTIECYEADGMPPRYIVYIGPTETFSTEPGTEPWDLTGAVGAIAGAGGSGSVLATELAMSEAGIRPGDEVRLVGYSQGGTVAGAIAGAGLWNVVGVETYGAPAPPTPLPGHLSGLVVRHSDDLVPALGSAPPPTDQVQVERQAYPDSRAIPSDVMLPAHEKSAYLETARAIDEGQSPQLREQLARADAFTAEYTQHPGATVTTYRFHAARVVADRLSGE